MGLTSVNVGNWLSFIVDATVSGANTYTTFRARVAGNIAAAGVYEDNQQAGNVAICAGWIRPTSTASDRCELERQDDRGTGASVVYGGRPVTAAHVCPQFAELMIYFYPTIAAKMPSSPNYGSALRTRKRRKALLDRLLTKKTGWNRCRKRQRRSRCRFPRVSSRRRGVGFEVQDAQREVWLQEEISYLVNEVGFDEQRARSEAVRRYDEQHGVMTT